MEVNDIEFFIDVCVLLGELNHSYSNHDWDVLGHECLIVLNRILQHSRSLPLSATGGLTGICIAANSLSKHGTRYNNFISEINEILIERLKLKIKECKDKIYKNQLEPDDYDTLYGLSGIGRYLLAQINNSPTLNKLLVDILDYLIEITVNNSNIPKWFIKKNKYNSLRNYFDNSIAHGMSGPLSLLSIAYKKGIVTIGHEKAIRYILGWLKKWKTRDSYGLIWKSIVTEEEYLNAYFSSNPYSYEAWCYGSPGIARSIWLAGEALNDPQTKNEALEVFEGIINRPREKWNIISPTICHGLSGLLLISQLMYEDTKLGYLIQLRDRILLELMEHYDEKAMFLFKDVTREGQCIDDSSFLTGAVGVVLVLNKVVNNSNNNWESILLIK